MLAGIWRRVTSPSLQPRQSIGENSLGQTSQEGEQACVSANSPPPSINRVAGCVLQ